MSYNNILEEELKNKVGHDYFASYNHTDIIERIDFAVAHPKTFSGQKHYFLWAEAKRANSDIYKALAQLILTIGKARTFERFLPPNYLGVFNSQIIAFIPYWEIQDIFSQNDFNWSVTPSNHNTSIQPRQKHPRPQRLPLPIRHRRQRTTHLYKRKLRHRKNNHQQNTNHQKQLHNHLQQMATSRTPHY